jgi:hypothetical protein
VNGENYLMYSEPTPWSRVLLDNRVVSELVRKFSFYGI